MSMTLSAPAAQSIPQDPAPAPAPAAPAAAAPAPQPAAASPATPATASSAETPAATALFDQVMARLASLAANTDDADAGAGDTAAPGPDGATTGTDDTQHDTDLPAMATPVMPLLMNFTVAAPATPAPAPLVGAAASEQDTPPAPIAADAGATPAHISLPVDNVSTPAPVSPPAANDALSQPAAPQAPDARASSEQVRARAMPVQADQADTPAPVTYASARAAASADQADAKNTVTSTAPATPATNLWAASTSSSSTAATPGESVKLAGAPAQWKQPLRDALGERLQMQVNSNSEQAVIRLDPPDLGRIDIAIRREAGTLQVNVSASNNDVLQQLRGIGENMRLDLAHRQNSEVSVTISAAPRNQGASTDADGRQRQQGAAPEQDERIPTRALADADLTSSHFAPLARGE